MKFNKTVIIASIATLFSAAALASTAVSVKDLPKGSYVTLNGTVEDFDSEHTFMLRDPSGSIKIDLSSANSVALKEGEKVSITGTVNQTILGTDVVATSVTEDKGVGQQVGEAIDSVTGQNAAGSARTVTIQTMPDTGFVKLNGIVESVESEKKFTLKDAYGKIDINITSSTSASLNKGTEVTVIGYVEKAILGKHINATEVDIRSSGTPIVNK